MIQINRDKCIGCGKCVEDCFPKSLMVVDGKAQPVVESCMKCGHCVAVCPTNAVSIAGYDMTQVLEFKDINQNIDAEVYLNHLKGRRSIRRFTDTPVTKQEIATIIEAGRYSPTGGNLQNVTYHVMQDDIKNFKDLVFDTLYDMGVKAKGSKEYGWYGDFWIHMHDAYVNDHVDNLFFDAKTVIVVASDSPQSACLAAAHMETMIYGMNLGMVYSGFTSRAIEVSDKLQTYLELRDGYHGYAVLVIGHPDVTYYRTVPRKEAEVIWK